MAVDLIIAQDAIQDIGEAYAWYEKQHIGLGEEYLTCVGACFDRVKRMPESCPIVYKNYRRALVRRFPFAVFYEYSDGGVTVFSIFHQSRDPRKWKERPSR